MTVYRLYLKKMIVATIPEFWTGSLWARSSWILVTGNLIFYAFMHELPVQNYGIVATDDVDKFGWTTAQLHTLLSLVPSPTWCVRYIVFA